MATKKTRKRVTKAKNNCATRSCECHVTYTEMLSIAFGVVGAASAAFAFLAMSTHIIG